MDNIFNELDKLLELVDSMEETEEIKQIKDGLEELHLMLSVRR